MEVPDDALPPDVIYAEWKSVMCGQADQATRQRVAAALDDPHSPLQAFLSMLRSDDASFLAGSLGSSESPSDLKDESTG